MPLARRRLLALGAALLLAGCGTTVGTVAGPATPQSAPDGLGAAPQAPGAIQAPGGGVAPGGAGVTQPGGSAVVGGDAPITTTGGSVPSAAPKASGAGRVTAPLSVGITYIDNSQSTAAVGAEDPRTVNARNVTEAMVKALNARGGVQGRRLVPVYFQFNGQSADYSTQAAEACSRFTEDNHVALVIDNSFGTTGGFRECLQKRGVPSLTTQSEGDRASSRAATLHASPSGMVLERQYGAVLEQLVATKYVGSGNQVGVILEDCPDVNRAWDGTLAPLAKRLGLKAPLVRRFECAVGYSSLGNAGSAISGALLAFNGAGVDRVMFVSHFEDVLLLLFGPAAESQAYHPGYMLSSGAQPHYLRTQLPDTQWAQFHGVGGSPYGDTDEAKPTGADPQCLQLVTSAGLLPANYDDVGTVLFICAPYLLLDAVLARTAGAADTRSLVTAIAGLGTSFVSPGNVAGRTRFGPDRRDGGDAVRVFAYVPACQCLRYTAPAVQPPQ
ncbi:MAG: ABC transporter substrate-binding protein [Frankiaceae bacterium]|nr:ABC transporter substrate-binding protein [Frankiaceae bacterium]